MKKLTTALLFSTLLATAAHAQQQGDEGEQTADPESTLNATGDKKNDEKSKNPCDKNFLEMTEAEREQCNEIAADPGVRTSPWYASMRLGTQFLPEYTEEGTNEGFRETRATAGIDVNGGWHLPALKWQRDDKAGLPFHWEVSLDFLGQPVVESQMAETQDETDAEATVDDFTDVADTVALTTDFYLGVFQWDKITSREVRDTATSTAGFCDPAEGEYEGGGTFNNYQSNLGPFLKLTTMSREEVDASSGDSVILYGSAGIRYTFSDYRKLCYRNGLPRGSISLGYGYYEDFGGAVFGSQHPIEIEALYRLPVDVPVYIGANAIMSTGDGPDMFYVTLDYRFRSDRVLQLFGL